jgi:epoxyqueuosine reductase QueG
VAYVLPFAEEVVRANREADGTSPSWALAYRETNALLNHIAAALTESLAERGVRAAWQPATHNWDPQTQVTRWSHKSVAAIAGLGSFGLHHMLITDLGCAGRFGSVVIDARIEPTTRPQLERCLFFADGSCTWCVKACPAGALTATDPGDAYLDKGRCRRRIDEVEAELGADVCGKCAVGPCSLQASVRDT